MTDETVRTAEQLCDPDHPESGIARGSGHQARFSVSLDRFGSLIGRLL